jgi:hypothetical protein
MKPEEMTIFAVNLVTIGIEDSSDMHQCIGGSIIADFGFTFKAYFYDENSALESDQGINTDAYNIIDTITRHFAKEIWLTQEMKDVINDYCFRLVLNGAVKSTDMQKEGGGIIPGYAISYNTFSIDTDTSSTTVESFAHEKLEGVTFAGNDGKTKYNWLPDVVKFVADLTAYNAITTATVGESYYVESEKSIYTVKTIDPDTSLITDSVIYALVLNDVFISVDDTAYCWLFVTDVVKTPLTTFELD